MARRPGPGLPDVFAKPGGAPPRGTSIEDLPASASPPEQTEPGHVEPEQAKAWAADADSGSTTPVQAAGVATRMPTEPPPIQTEDTPAPPVSPTTASPAAGSGLATRSKFADVPPLVWAILVVSLSAPLWEGAVLSTFGIYSSSERVAAQDATRLAQQDARLIALEQRVASTTTQVDAMRADLALATQRAAQATTDARALALLRLADALRGAAPFDTELSVVRGLGGGDGKLQPVLTQLMPYAAAGAPTQDQLMRDLRVLHDSLERAIQQANPGSAWRDLVNWAGLNRAQTPALIDPSLRAARLALTELAAGDITGAVDQASQVNDAFQADFADWVTEAKARLAADAALHEIGTTVTRPAGTP